MIYSKYFHAVGTLFALFFGSNNASAAILEATEFYNAATKHYFITTSLTEAAGIDGGAAGEGWSRTGGGFTVYSLPTDGLGDTVPVCRFYARGSNSHFFTANKLECADLRFTEDLQRQRSSAVFQGWEFEGVAFYAVATRAGFCPAGRAPVYRFYNQRGTQNDSNHRFTTDVAEGLALAKLGWKDEGIAFCSLSTSNPLPLTINDSNESCGVAFPLTRTLTYDVIVSGVGVSGAIETQTRRAVSLNIGSVRFDDQDAIAIASYTVGTPDEVNYNMFTVSDSQTSRLGFTSVVGGFTTTQTHAPAPKLPRKWGIGQSVSNTFSILTRYGNVQSGEPLDVVETVSFLRRESVITPAGVFPNACVIRTLTTYPQSNIEIVSDGWIVEGIGTVKSAETSTRTEIGIAPIVNTSESLLVSIQ
jgi:hypothetical protein